jgi:pyruvate formate lyase activating enzyme
MTDSKSLIFDIKRYAINDGPGIRIVIFLKGCNLNCAWCHNPEGISSAQERMYNPAKCIKCGTCVVACPETALTLTEEGIVTDTGLCQLNGLCAAVCPTKAIELSGKPMSISEIMQEIEKERVFFEQSGGGVTFSGGEPMMHPDFLVRLLDECGSKGIHRAVDTAGLVSKEVLLRVAARTDLFLYDLKMMDSERHRKWTGVPNEKILRNLQTLAEYGANIMIRIPLVGGVNLEATARFIASLAGEKKIVNLLPYHKIAQTKYGKLGKPEEFQLFGEPTKTILEEAISIFQNFELVATT